MNALTRRGTPQNVVLLVLDALRADAVEPFGAPPGSSPALAQLARQGTAVAGVRSTGTWTLPAHSAMFTGALARGLGLGQSPDQTPSGAAPVVRSHRDRLLAHVLNSSGYLTRGVTTNMWCGKTAGFDTGFDEFVELDTSRHAALGGGLGQRVKWDWEALRGRSDDGAAETMAVIEKWLGGRDDRPFFLFVNLLECHSPYLPPRPYAPPALARVRAAEDAHRYLTFEAITRTCLGVQEVPQPVLRRMRRFYAACLRYADDWVRRLLDRLADRGRLDETLVIVCSDHGENLGEGGLISHAVSLDDRLLRVPFIAAGPGAERFKGMLSLAELPARVATAVGLREHPWDDGLVSGLPVAQWDGLRPPPEQLEAFGSKLRLGEEEIRRLTSPQTCAVSGRFKLIRGAEPGGESLYDLEADPLELAPLCDERAMAARAGDELASLRTAVNDPRAQQTVDITLARDAVSADEATDIERKMRLLGYL